ncbi:MAG: R3H domain-containing nucleic acid-binding protein [Cyanobacteria bacterium P01_G01_bin.19]
MDSQLSAGKEWLDRLLALMNLTAQVSTDGFETVGNDNDASWLNIDGTALSPEQKEQFIGNKGERIDAIQYLANTILNLNAEPEQQNSFVVELDGYRVKRNRELADLTKEAVARVKSTGEEAEIQGLSSAERKQIHSILQSIEGLESESRGQEPNRRLIVRSQSSQS